MPKMRIITFILLLIFYSQAFDLFGQVQSGSYDIRKQYTNSDSVYLFIQVADDWGEVLPYAEVRYDYFGTYPGNMSIRSMKTDSNGILRLTFKRMDKEERLYIGYDRSATPGTLAIRYPGISLTTKLDSTQEIVVILKNIKYSPYFNPDSTYGNTVTREDFQLLNSPMNAIWYYKTNEPLGYYELWVYAPRGALLFTPSLTIPLRISNDSAFSVGTGGIFMYSFIKVNGKTFLKTKEQQIELTKLSLCESSPPIMSSQATLEKEYYKRRYANCNKKEIDLYNTYFNNVIKDNYEKRGRIDKGIDGDTTVKSKKIFLAKNKKSGTDIIGYYKSGKLEKITETAWRCDSTWQIKYYFSNDKLIYVYERKFSYERNDSATCFNRSSIDSINSPNDNGSYNYLQVKYYMYDGYPIRVTASLNTSYIDPYKIAILRPTYLHEKLLVHTKQLSELLKKE